jgi:hypothetical protein
MTRIHDNNSITTLAYGISSAATSMIVTDYTSFPGFTSGQYTMNVTLQSGGLYEIVKVTATSTSTFTIVRAQEGTTALNWSAGTSVSIRVTASSIDDKLSIGDGTTKTISAGDITATSTYHLVDTEAAAATDDLATIGGNLAIGTILVLRAADSARTVVVKDGTYLKLAGDCTLDNSEDTIVLICTAAGTWNELCRSDNGA